MPILLGPWATLVWTQRGSGRDSAAMEGVGLAPQTSCDRCGTFALLTPCGDLDVCDECLARLQRERPTLDSVLSEVGRLLLRVGPVSALILVGARLPLELVALEVHVPFAVSTIYGSTVELWAAGAVFLIAVRAARGEATEVTRALVDSWDAFWDLFATRLLVFFAVLLFTLLLVIPGIVQMLSYAVSSPIVLVEGGSGLDAMRCSSTRMRGVRTMALGAYSVASIPLVAWFALVMGIAYVGRPLLADRAFVSTLGMASGVAIPVCMVLIHFVTAALYGATRYRGDYWLYPMVPARSPPHSRSIGQRPGRPPED